MKTHADNKYVEEIWSLAQKNYHAAGMGHYGRAWEVQQEYYRKLPFSEKHKYEEAILILAESQNTQKAKFALTACGELADVFSSGWNSRVIALVETLVGRGLEPTYKNTTTYSLLRLIWEFHIESLLPYVKEFRERITTNFKHGILPRNEWVYLYSQVSRILIRISPIEFWKEFAAFHEDSDLLGLLGVETKAVISIWVSFGTVTYGLDWLEKMVAHYSNSSNDTLKSQVLLSIKNSFSIVMSKDSAKRVSKQQFIDWAASQLTS